MAPKMDPRVLVAKLNQRGVAASAWSASADLAPLLHQLPVDEVDAPKELTVAGARVVRDTLLPLKACCIKAS